jgi:hypothetical protein
MLATSNTSSIATVSAAAVATPRVNDRSDEEGESILRRRALRTSAATTNPSTTINTIVEVHNINSQS